MDPTIAINERIDVVCVFKKQSEGADICTPRKMRWHGREIELSELALRHPTQQGRRMIHVFHVGDGINGYRIEFDAEALTWTLACLISAEDHA